MQAFINTAREIYRKIQDGVFDVSNEVSSCWNTSSSSRPALVLLLADALTCCYSRTASRSATEQDPTSNPYGQLTSQRSQGGAASDAWAGKEARCLRRVSLSCRSGREPRSEGGGHVSLSYRSERTAVHGQSGVAAV